ncbi:long-chain fatty acid--CoA ligase [Rhodoblastus sp.]|uniref:long-chain fatty acid--CoA ligase n=1 Tax=Rhodoblastus sp. TaxID=1962975 RepID=UPI0025D3468C|nr:long-chain fatty acid--CoA ligase [Rhodoblastus sp.]
MLGLMQRRELLISSLIAHAARHHGEAEVVSRRDDGRIARTTYAELETRARKLVSVLRDLGVAFSDRVATLAMNSDRHLELYYAISGMGAVCHTINPRLSQDDIAYIVDHAEDGFIFTDPAFLPIVAAVAPRVAHVLRGVIALCEPDEIPACELPPEIALYCYETLLDQARDAPDWPIFAEETASALCYTSGTTGKPKGALYSHRSTVLYAMATNAPDVFGLRATDRVLPAVPMFHVNAWGLPYVAPMAGASLLMPGRHLDPVSLLALLNDERATFSVGVPTVWLNLIGHMRQTEESFETLQRILAGGAAFPRALIAEFEQRGVSVRHGWGMTESSPIVTANAPKPTTAALDAEALLDQQAKQGRVVYGADVRAENEAGEVPRDGVTQGNLALRGHWVANGYYLLPETEIAPDAWFPTGDVGVVDAEGYVLLTDRTKDLIKSGGEWISSIALENIAVGHPDVAEAAAIAEPDEKWGERPLLVVVPRTGHEPQPEDVRAFFNGKVPNWSIPDRVIIAEELPHGATGKILKSELRRIYTPREG